MPLHERPFAARAVLVVALLARAGAAQAQALVTSESADLDHILDIAECQGATPDALVLAWSTSAFSQSGTYDVLASDTVGCPSGPATPTAHTAVLGTVAATGAVGSFPPAGSPLLTVPGVLEKVAIPCLSPSSALFLCVDLLGGGVTTHVAQGSLALDLLAPAAPVAIAADPQVEALVVSWTQGRSPTLVASSAGYRLTATASADPQDVHTVEVTGGGTVNARFPGLRGGATYDVFVVALSPGGNPSPRSNVVQGTPAPAAPDGDAGGTSAGGAAPASGGCAAGPAGLAALLAALAAGALRGGARRRA